MAVEWSGTDWIMMIGRGRLNDIFLFEVTEQDLMDCEPFPDRYRAGNVLLFDSLSGIRIGTELAMADDLDCAYEFIGSQFSQSQSAGELEALSAALVVQAVLEKPENPENLTAMENPKSATTSEVDLSGELSDEIDKLKLRIEQRDGLLSDLSSRLRLQKDENELLQLLLDQTQTQIAMEVASRDELMEDLQRVSADTKMIEDNLERVMEEKFRLEQELAERITELLEFSMENDGLRHQVANMKSQPEAQPAPAPTVSSQVDQVLTMSSGKQIHIFHEFPSLGAARPLEKLRSVAALLLRGAVTAELILSLTLVGSILATSWSNNISYGESLDLLIRHVSP
jgi:regulator of replication initiation timing